MPKKTYKRPQASKRARELKKGPSQKQVKTFLNLLKERRSLE